ncbi:multicopper oxidase family protein [Georgenia subflava]|uniref:Multicopper oxidase domain-containing protein n=1 Tax=Georgenia subflava TaxID=1622177 RepID=A0A6N7ENA5_9MICO|nr:multicopper oxidase family protein [Georgenia subflava]MPV37626.1 multicopper oxidase domain-containing protein [Georgenia subflava]
MTGVAGRPSLLRRPATWGAVLLAGLLAVLGAAWVTSLVPGTVSVMSMGYPDLGGGPPVAHEMPDGTSMAGAAHAGHDEPSVAALASIVDVTDLAGPPDGAPDVRMTLTAEAGTIELGTGERLEGYTLNGSSPGPTIEAVQGELVEITLVNASVPDGVTLHWHGIDVPNAEDGVAGVTQDAVPPGSSHVYRFVVEDAGTFWYHSHQVSHEQVRRGLFGAFVVRPEAQGELDVVLPVHTYDGLRTVAGSSGTSFHEVPGGTTARVRVVNTDGASMQVWVDGAQFRVVAVDGRDLNAPTALDDVTVPVSGGGRVDLEVPVPESGAVLIGLGGGSLVAVGPDDPGRALAAPPAERLDLLTYGSPAPLGLDPADADRRFDYTIGRRPGFLDGRPGLWWSINGHLYPDVPMYLVQEGDVVVMTITNSSGQVHPMHLHGHHVVVLSRDGVAATGSPWWVDSLDVHDGESYEIAFVADNPGIWMDHCHDLRHAADGMVAHLAYAGVTTPFLLGGEAANHPE